MLIIKRGRPGCPVPTQWRLLDQLLRAHANAIADRILAYARACFVWVWKRGKVAAGASTAQHIQNVLAPIESPFPIRPRRA